MPSPTNNGSPTQARRRASKRKRQPARKPEASPTSRISKAELRRIKNRESAAQSRQRKRQQLERLHKRNADLSAKVQTMASRVQELTEENRLLNETMHGLERTVATLTSELERAHKRATASNIMLQRQQQQSQQAQAAMAAARYASLRAATSKADLANRIPSLSSSGSVGLQAGVGYPGGVGSMGAGMGAGMGVVSGAGAGAGAGAGVGVGVGVNAAGRRMAAAMSFRQNGGARELGAVLHPPSTDGGQSQGAPAQTVGHSSSSSGIGSFPASGLTSDTHSVRPGLFGDLSSFAAVNSAMQSPFHNSLHSGSSGNLGSSSTATGGATGSSASQGSGTAQLLKQLLG